MIEVRAQAGAYRVHCRWGALDDLGATLHDAGLSGNAYVISDATVAPLYGERALTSLRGAGFEPRLRAVPAGESSKSLDVARDLYDWLLEERAERRSPVIALGGGVVGDLTGFVAATYLRGVPFVQAPTSLLAMVDAAIGGKVGVDHPRGKNLIGAFHAPRAVVEDTSVLKTLPERAYREGFGEIIKHAFALDATMIGTLRDQSDALLAVDADAVTPLVAHNAALKAAVVSEDERENGRRVFLNFGHTTAHALEATLGYRGLLHGEAVAIGMIAAAEIGRRAGVTPQPVVDAIRELIARYGLPVRMPRVEIDALVRAMSHDKKVSAQRLRWVLLEDAGRPVVRDDVPESVVRDVLAALA